jgi:hypothetical protein
MIAALFDDRARAEQALQALIGSGVARDRIALVGDAGAHDVSAISGFRDLGRDDTLAALHDLPLPPQELAGFEPGLRRGGVVIAARVDASALDQAVAVLDMFDPVDLDDASEARRGAASGGPAEPPVGAGLTGGAMGGQTNTGAMPGTGSLTDGTHALGAADLRTDEASLSDMGSSVTATGGRGGEERAGAPGVLAMASGPDAAQAAKLAPAVNAGAGSDAKPDLFRRETSSGRVRVYGRP